MLFGCNSFEDVRKGLGMPASAPLNFDYIFVDIDNKKGILNFGMEQFDKHYFVTSFDMYSIRKGMEALKVIGSPVKLTKVLFTNEIHKKDNEYINYLSMGSKVEWEGETIYFPFEIGDQTVLYQNQRNGKIRYQELSGQYKEQLMYMAYQLAQLEGQDDYNAIRKVLKRI